MLPIRKQKMQQPKFTIDDVKYAENPATFRRADDLYRSGKVGKISEHQHGYTAVVQGTHPYSVSLSVKRIDDGDCTCYMGQHGRLCKHMLALALAVLHVSGKMDKAMPESQAPTDLQTAKEVVTAGMRKLRRYTSPSRTWFSYQRTLATGAGMIAQGISGLPTTKENAAYLWSVIVRIDKKLANGVDDSDGVVGSCAAKIIEQLAGYAETTPELTPDIKRYCNKKTNFSFEDELRAVLTVINQNREPNRVGST